jgi:hypothetical protein
MRETMCYMQWNAEHRRFYHSANRTQICRMYESKLPVHQVHVTEGEMRLAMVPYWGWWNNETERFEMIWPQRYAVEMCFPYGTGPEEARGRGWLLPVDIEDLGVVSIDQEITQ